MNNEDFEASVIDSFNRSSKVLTNKAIEYASDEDRLENFKQAAAVQNIPATQALLGMMTKHYVSICKMAKCPEMYNLEKWDEKIVDLRNYTFLLDALLRDLECYLKESS